MSMTSNVQIWVYVKYVVLLINVIVSTETFWEKDLTK